MKKYTKEELLNMDAIEVYKLVLKNNIVKKFPDGFWQQPEAKNNAAKCTIFLIEEILKYDDKTLKEKNSASLFNKNKLGGMLVKCFNTSPYEAINNAYPNKFKEWEFNITPRGYWNDKKNAIEAIKWLLEEKLKLNDEQIKKQLSVKLFKENGLGGVLQNSFNDSPYEAINSTYPNKFKEWEFNYVPMGYWDNKENSIKAIKWLVEEKLKLNDEELKEQLSVKLFKDNGLNGMLQHCFNYSPYEAINTAYPNKFKEWEFNYVPMGYWDNKENPIKAIKWLVEEKLKLTENEIKKQISIKSFKDNGLYGMINKCFNCNIHKAINSAYPNKILK